MDSRLPALTGERRDPAGLNVDVLVIALQQRDDQLELQIPQLAKAAIRPLIEAARSVGHTGELNLTARVPAPAGVQATSVLLIGLGKRDTSESVASHEVLRKTAGTAMRSLNAVGSVALAFPTSTSDAVEAVAMGALLGAYRYTAYKSAPSQQQGATRIVISLPEAVTPDFDRVDVIARAVCASRDRVNQPPLDLHPASFAESIVREAKASDLSGRVEVTVLAEDELREQGFGGLMGVGGGSAQGPRLVRVSYAPNGAISHLSLVGKGITFDSGGISIKPAAKMEKMKSDMAGAAAAVDALFAVARLRLPIRMTAWLALAENMPSGSAARPSDVLRIADGTTVEVTNTDAEGRLVLADALVAAQEEHPDLIIDIATLTGAQVTALGYRTSGVMGSASARQQVLEAAEHAGESMWGMPIPDEMIGYFDSMTADLRNAGAPAGGMLAAAAFLREFIKPGVEWAHIDIAGPAFTADSAYGYTVLGGTGVPVRTLVELAERASQPEGARGLPRVEQSSLTGTRNPKIQHAK